MTLHETTYEEIRFRREVLKRAHLGTLGLFAVTDSHSLALGSCCPNRLYRDQTRTRTTASPRGHATAEASDLGGPYQEITYPGTRRTDSRIPGTCPTDKPNFTPSRLEASPRALPFRMRCLCIWQRPPRRGMGTSGKNKIKKRKKKNTQRGRQEARFRWSKPPSVQLPERENGDHASKPQRRAWHMGLESNVKTALSGHVATEHDGQETRPSRPSRAMCDLVTQTAGRSRSSASPSLVILEAKN
ncbi:hypothetical protein LX36DRAFT_213101 [Colletotrichum falcatum]|nr:hypothetical protein LX36DRAFT_213101 [Colletotrichum falcatum]